MKAVLAVAMLLLKASIGYGQFYGSLGLGGAYNSNVDNIDTIGSDVVFTPSFTVGYDANINDALRFYISAGAMYDVFTSRSDRSYSTLFAGIVPTYHFLPSSTAEPEALANGNAQRTISIRDYIKELAEVIEIVRKQLPTVRPTLDSSLELLSVVDELIATTTYTTSVKEIVLGELRDQLRAIESRGKPLAPIAERWKLLISRLSTIEADNDLAELEMLISDGASNEETNGIGKVILTSLSPTFVRSQNLTGSDFYPRSRSLTPSIRDRSSYLSLPLHISRQSNSATYSQYSNTDVSASLRFVLRPEGDQQYGFSSEMRNTIFPNDSVYSGTEWRLRAAAKWALSPMFVVGAESFYGAKRYSDPLTIYTRDFQTNRTLRTDSQTVGSSFDQLGFGAFGQYFFGEDVSVGFVGAITRTPSSRAYITDRYDLDTVTLGLVSDEFNYDMSSLMLFTSLNLSTDLELGVDIRYEHRTYAAAEPITSDTLLQRPGGQGQPVPRTIVFDQYGANRIEHGVHLSALVSKSYYFEAPILSVFNSAIFDLGINYSTVASSLDDFSYDSFTAYLTAALNF